MNFLLLDQHKLLTNNKFGHFLAYLTLNKNTYVRFFECSKRDLKLVESPSLKVPEVSKWSRLLKKYVKKSGNRSQWETGLPEKESNHEKSQRKREFPNRDRQADENIGENHSYSRSDLYNRRKPQCVEVDPKKQLLILSYRQFIGTKSEGPSVFVVYDKTREAKVPNECFSVHEVHQREAKFHDLNLRQKNNQASREVPLLSKKTSDIVYDSHGCIWTWLLLRIGKNKERICLEAQWLRLVAFINRGCEK